MLSCVCMCLCVRGGDPAGPRGGIIKSELEESTHAMERTQSLLYPTGTTLPICRGAYMNPRRGRQPALQEDQRPPDRLHAQRHRLIVAFIRV